MFGILTRKYITFLKALHNRCQEASRLLNFECGAKFLALCDEMLYTYTVRGGNEVFKNGFEIGILIFIQLLNTILSMLSMLQVFLSLALFTLFAIRVLEAGELGRA